MIEWGSLFLQDALDWWSHGEFRWFYDPTMSDNWQELIFPPIVYNHSDGKLCSMLNVQKNTIFQSEKEESNLDDKFAEVFK